MALDIYLVIICTFVGVVGIVLGSVFSLVPPSGDGGHLFMVYLNNNMHSNILTYFLLLDGNYVVYQKYKVDSTTDGV